MASQFARKQTPPTWIEALADGYAVAGFRAKMVAGILAAAAVVVSVISVPGLPGILGASLAMLSLTIAVIDWRRFIIPNELTGAGFALAIAYAVVREPNAMLAAVAFTILRGAALALVFLLIRDVYERIRGREGFGLGDVKLAAVAGAWLECP